MIHVGDCREVMAGLDPNSIDAIVTDPPYELGFMGKGWDDSGIANDVTTWAAAYRVLKPGGHLAAFGGTRTYHRMAVAIEDAGFEIRDSLMWLYGSGFPKSLDVSKAIDKRGGVSAPFEAFRDAVLAALADLGRSRSDLRDALGNHMISHYLTAGSQPAIPNWRDYQIIRDFCALGPEWDHLFAEAAKRDRIGTMAVSPFAFAPGQDADRGSVDLDITAPATDAAREWEGWGTALKPAFEPIVLARKPLSGTVAQTVTEHGTGALNIDAARVGAADDLNGGAYAKAATPIDASSYGMARGVGQYDQPAGRWPANVILDPEAGALLDASLKQTEDEGASRFFYTAKASRAEREAGLDGLPQARRVDSESRAEGAPGSENPRLRTSERRNHHPTVKPVSLMRWLVRLIAPPGGTVLDPFTGSGTTGMAAGLEGFEFVGAELDPEYAEIARRRIAWANAEPREFDIDAVEAGDEPVQGALI